MKRTMFGWSKPLSISISLQTLDSFPLTRFFGIIFNATSFVYSSSVEALLYDEKDRTGNLGATESDDFRASTGGGFRLAAAPRSATDN